MISVSASCNQSMRCDEKSIASLYITHVQAACKRRNAVPLTGLNVHSNLLRLIRDGGKREDWYLCPITYSLHCHHQNDCIRVGSCVSRFKVSSIVWAKSQDSVHKARFLKRKERQSRLKTCGQPCSCRAKGAWDVRGVQEEVAPL